MSSAVPAAPVPTGAYDFCEHIRLYERDLLRRALEANAHHQKNTAKYLEMTYHQLRAQLRKHGLIGG
jgi:psp operon transcriptional activator